MKNVCFILAPYWVMNALGVKDREISYSQIVPGHFSFGDAVVPVWKYGEDKYLSFDGKKMSVPLGKKFHKTEVGMTYEFGEFSSFTLVEDNGQHKKNFEMESPNPIGFEKKDKFYADLHYSPMVDCAGW